MFDVGRESVPAIICIYFFIYISLYARALSACLLSNLLGFDGANESSTRFLPALLATENVL